MIDSKLEGLYKFNDVEYVSRTLMIEFTKRFYEHYGISKPYDAPLLTEYKTTIKDTNPFTGVDTKYEYNHTIGGFIKAKIIASFDKLILEYYNTIRYVDDPIKKAAYYKLIYKQLNELFKQLKQLDFITIYLIDFKNGIDLFKRKFGFTSIQRATYQRRLENSYETLVTTEITQQDITYKLERIFSKLKINDFLPLLTDKKDFLKLFSGNIVDNRIKWSGTLSSFYYFNKKLNKLSFIKDLKDNKWSVADKCFYVLNKDNVEYNVSKFRTQKDPSKKVIDVLDKILDA